MNNRKAFLDMIAFSELGKKLLDLSQNGYNVCVGSTPDHPILFTDYSKHPRLRCKKVNSDAAGRYQLMGRYFAPYCRKLGLKDFSPASQDSIAIQQIKERKALADIDAGRIRTAIGKCKNIWASFPGAGYGQHENIMDVLLAEYVAAGGELNE